LARTLTQQRLKEVLDYDPETGVFRWKERISIRIMVGEVAGQIRPSAGYWFIGIDGYAYRAHRLAWLYMTGEFPPPGVEIDHKDTDRTKNSWLNLRLATRSQNNANWKAPRHNTSGLKGVCFHKGAQKWCAQIHKDRKRIYLGLFLSKEEAKAVHDAKAVELYGEFARAA
jgi:hypothetical protein